MPEAAVTAGQILDWAREVAHDFVNRGVPMEKTAMKIAKDHGLNHEQLSRVCQATNHEVYKAEAKNNPNGLFEFPVLKSEAVIEALDQPPGTKTAAIDDSDYYRPPPPSPLALSHDEIFDKLFPKTAAAADRVGTMTKTATLRIEMNKLSAAEGEVRSQMVGAEMKRENEEEGFYQLVKKRLIEGRKFEDVFEDLMLDSEGMGDENPSPMSVRSLMERIMGRLKAENLIEQSEELPKDTPRMHAAKNMNMSPERKVASDRFTALVRQDAQVRVLRDVLEGLSGDLHEKQAAYMDHVRAAKATP